MKEIVLGLIEHSSWAALVLLFVIWFRPQITELLNKLRFIKAGNLQLEFSTQLSQIGFDKEKLKKFSYLTSEEINIFLLASFSDGIGFQYQIEMPQNELNSHIFRLADFGLLEVVKNPTNPENIGHNLTEDGRRFRAVLIDTTKDLLKTL